MLIAYTPGWLKNTCLDFTMVYFAICQFFDQRSACAIKFEATEEVGWGVAQCLEMRINNYPVFLGSMVPLTYLT